ncbi:AAA family ATPase [Candidatus Kaiserbacteria bacterium]|nr:AAA family ATPase [Candidatus Kaiserbacteria bacterium]
MIIGITGTDGAGKGTVVRYLVEQKGFTHYSVRDYILEEMKRRGVEHTRNQMRLIGNALREEFGNDVMIKKPLAQMQKDGVENVVIESIRAVAEAEKLKEAGGILIAVDADQKIRYERVQERRSSSDKVSFEEFVRHEELESNDPAPHGLQKQKVIGMADYIISNDGTVEELNVQTERVLQKVGI